MIRSATFLFLTLAFGNLPAPAESYVYDDRKVDWVAPVASKWKIPKQILPTKDVPVVGFEVQDFGAKGDGVTDDTAAFQSALIEQSKAGGGTVWVPAGRYAIRGNLSIPVNVTLRGEWTPPGTKGPEGTILQAYAGRGSDKGAAFITIYSNAALQGVTIWYPEQTADAPTPYPCTILRKEVANFKPCMTVQQVTLVNAWQGIKIGSVETGNINWMLREVYLTALQSGIDTDMTNDTGRLYQVYLSPKYWSQSGLVGSPKPGAPALVHMKTRGTGITIKRHDFTHHGPFQIEGYAVGLIGAASATKQHEGDFANYGDDHFQGHFYGIKIQDCGIAAKLGGIHPAGVVFTDSELSGDNVAVQILENPRAAVLFNRCLIASRSVALDNQGAYALSLNDCRVKGGIHHAAGGLAIAGGTLSALPSQPAIQLGKRTAGATIQGVKGLAATSQVAGWREGPNFVFDPTALPTSRLSFAELDLAAPCAEKPAHSKLFIVSQAPYVCAIDGSQDASEAIQKALQDASTSGGGIVFLPPGVYRIEKRLKIPSGVELRGANASPHHPAKSATLLQIFAGRTEPNGQPAIQVNARAGVRGIGLIYPEQNYKEPAEYSFLFQGTGEGIYLIDIAAAGVDRLVDFFTQRCDRHFVNGMMANPLRVGIRVGAGSQGGKLFNCQFITHVWSLSAAVWSDQALQKLWNVSLEEFPRMAWQNKESGERHTQFLRENLRAFILDDVSNQTLFFNFTYASLSGLDAGWDGSGVAKANVFQQGVDVSLNGARLGSSSELQLVNYMVYGYDPNRAIGIQVGQKANPSTSLNQGLNPHASSLVLRSNQIVGNLRNGLKLSEGSIFLEQPLFTGWGSQGIAVDQGHVSLRAPLFYSFEPTPKLVLGSAAATAIMEAAIFPGPLSVSGEKQKLVTRGNIVLLPAEKSPK